MKDMEREKFEAEIAKLMAETAKINREAAKISRETFWYPVVIATAWLGAAVAFGKFFS